ncbi:TIGR03013 family XrtA/PEP-CTERM system glycosyltransferase [Pseudoxanthomonas composti]|nr:TIGR03013 family XrtA/PEP-CTERM system glycosyltransferase [Pseudoxanthomonas composti]
MNMMQYSRKTRAMRVLWLAEMLVLTTSVIVAAWVRFHDDEQTHRAFFELAPLRALMLSLAVTGAMAALGLYQSHVRHSINDLLLRLTLSFGFGGVALAVAYYLIPVVYIGRGVMVMALVLAFIGITLLRLLVLHVIRVESLRQRILVVGAGTNANLLNTRLRRRSDRATFVIVGFVPVEGQVVEVDRSLLVEGKLPLGELATRLQIDEILIAPDERRGGLPMEQMLECVQRGISIIDLSTFFEREAGMVQLNVADPSWLVFSGGFDYSTPRRLSKRCFDLAAAFLLLLVAWPFMLLVAAAVWLESGGPVLYSQERVGEGGRHFKLTKFRSMRVDAEGDGKARWASRGDDRVTRVGKFIRLTRLDELPQLFAVLRGHMSFVGPRPERPQFVDMLNHEIRYYGVRHCVKPGLTGWAQLRYPYGASVKDAEEKLKFDLFYVKNHGLVFDLMILLQTVEVVMFGRGAR